MKQALRELRRLSRARINYGSLVEAFIMNKELLKTLQVTQNTPCRCGLMGCVLETYDPLWVVKLTGDPYEVRLFEVLRDENIQTGFVKFKKIYPLENDTFIIVKQKVMPFNDLVLSTTLQAFASKYSEFIKTYYQEMSDVGKNQKSLNQKSLDAAFLVISEYSFEEITEIFDSLQRLSHLGYKVTDIGLSNLGFTDENQPVLYDAQIESLLPP